jgi:hypothetical protein
VHDRHQCIVCADISIVAGNVQHMTDKYISEEISRVAGVSRVTVTVHDRYQSISAETSRVVGVSRVAGNVFA